MKAFTARVLILLLALSLLTACFCACGENEEDVSGTDTEPATEADTLDEVDAALARIGTVDWGGEDFCILYSNDIGGYEEEIYAENMAGQNSIINDAVYTRNKLMAELCHMNLVTVGKGWTMVGSAMDSEAKNAIGDYHMFTMPCDQTTGHATNGVLFNYLSLDSVDYDASWWDVGTVNFALDNRVFFLNGSWNIVDDEVTYIFMFNKQLISDRNMASPYDKVRAGDWTIDYFVSSLQGTANDHNGDGKMNDEDFYGFDGDAGNTFFFGCGLRYVINNRGMDMPELAMNSGMMDRAVTALDKIRTLTTSTDCYNGNGAKGHTTMFLEGRAIFFHECCSYLRTVNSSMDGDYGVVPPPKYDKAQDGYHTYMHGIGSVFSMPSTLKNTEEIGGVIETMAALSHRYLKPAYYDNMLTKRNVRDPDSSEMLDMILPDRVYDMGIYFGQLGFTNVFSDSVYGSANKFSSAYAKAERGYSKNITKILKTLQNQD